MTTRTPLAALIETRMQQLALDRAALGFRLGYRNPAKAAGRVYALCDGHITSTKSKTALRRLPTAIEVPAEVVETAVKATASLLAELKWHEDEKLRMPARLRMQNGGQRSSLMPQSWGPQDTDVDHDVCNLRRPKAVAEHRARPVGAIQHLRPASYSGTAEQTSSG